MAPSGDVTCKLNPKTYCNQKMSKKIVFEIQNIFLKPVLSKIILKLSQLMISRIQTQVHEFLGEERHRIGSMESLQ